jgi:hypothetical protein
VPEESRGLLDFESGKDRGRIYRIVRDSPAPRSAPATPPVRSDDLPQTVAALESPDEWWRADAQRRLVERADRSAIPLVEKIAAQATRAESRTRALWTLRGLDGLSAATITAALRDRHAGVREQGLHFAGAQIAQNGGGEFLPVVLAATNDRDARVRFCAALALAGSRDDSVVPALAALALRDGEDRWTRAAVLSGIAGRMEPFLAALQRERAANPAAFAVVIEHLGRIFGAGAPPDACRQFLADRVAETGGLPARISSSGSMRPTPRR